MFSIHNIIIFERFSTHIISIGAQFHVALPNIFGIWKPSIK